jgi:SPP1 gp7 family putative phage head morphogenesis protein
MTKLTVSPQATYPKKRIAERKIAMALKKAFKATKSDVLPKLVKKYKAVMEVHRKALHDETNYVLNELNLDDWIALVPTLSTAMGDVRQAAGKQTLTQLKVDDTDLFDKVNEDAVKVAKDRAAEMVGMKYVNGKLVPNPSAEWAITEATRSGIKDLVTTALTDGLTPAQLATKLQEDFLFSDYRSEMIARTEIATAHVDGTLDAWKASGLVKGKRWLVGTQEVCDECEDNESDGTIGLDEDFSSGDDAPPAHPHCACVLISSLLEDNE